MEITKEAVKKFFADWYKETKDIEETAKSPDEYGDIAADYFVEYFGIDG